MEKINLLEYQQKLLTWLNEDVLTLNFGVQFAVIFVGLVLGFILARAVTPRLNELVNKLSTPFKVTEVFYCLLRVTLPFFAMTFIFIGSKIIGGVGFPTNFAIAVTKLLLAWMFIRLMSQFIEHKFARNVIAFTVLGLAALSIFGVLDQTMATLDSIGFSIGEFRLSALSVAKGIIGIFVLLYAALFLADLTDRKIETVKSLNPSSRVLISKIARVFLVVMAVLIGLTSAGIDLSLFAVFSGAIGLGIGFGLQKVISNLFSGMLLLMDQSIKPGDIIEMDGTFGWVNHMGARYTELVTRDNKSYLVPNEEFITQQVINWSHGNTLVRVQTEFGVHYDADPHLVKHIAAEAAGKPERVVDSPAPVCHLVEFGDSSINFVLRYWIKDAEKGVMNTKGAVMLALWDALKENKVDIPYPHREVFMHKAS